MELHLPMILVTQRLCKWIPFATGAGTLASPWIVCTGAQFVNLANASYNVNGKYAKLGAHVDLNAAGWTAPTNFYINLDGQGFMLYNSPSGPNFLCHR